MHSVERGLRVHMMSWLLGWESRRLAALGTVWEGRFCAKWQREEATHRFKWLREEGTHHFSLWDRAQLKRDKVW